MKSFLDVQKTLPTFKVNGEAEIATTDGSTCQIKIEFETSAVNEELARQRAISVFKGLNNLKEVGDFKINRV